MQWVRDALSDKGPLNAATFANAILREKRSYGGGKGAAIRLQPDTTDLESLPVDEWLIKIRTLFNEEVNELNGRLVLIGLGLLDRSLREQLNQDGFWQALVDELMPPLDSVLSDQGRILFEGLPFSDNVPTQTDHALRQIDHDRLGRTAFARYLTQRISNLYPEDGAYAILLHGAWGAGKSTLLNFMGQMLTGENRSQEFKQDKSNNAFIESAARNAHKKERSQKNNSPDWLVVQFNAWRHQHLDPPWWALLDAVFHQTRHKLNLWQMVREFSWRFVAGRGWFLISLLVLIAIVWVLALGALSLVKTKAIDNKLMGVLEATSTLAAAGVTLWGIVSAVPRSLVMGSAEAARSYVNATRNPMNTIKARFETLIDHLSPNRLAIFIDDLDRCRSSYVVELLEGIQTLFRDAPVVYVVAADRRWINACYEETYQSMKPWVHAPGKSLGMLFLEKTFQLSTPVPAIAPPMKETYWNGLIGVQRDGTGMSRNEAEQKAAENLGDVIDENAMMDRLRETRDPIEQEVLRKKIVERLAETEVMVRTEHALQKFTPLLEANPRAMKRLVNAYSTNRALALLSHIDIERDQLVLWTILSMRWPQLAEALVRNPDLVQMPASEASSRIPDDIRHLLNSPEVNQVLSGGDVTDKSLDAKSLRLAAMLWI